jgi:hypothetical protein
VEKRGGSTVEKRVEMVYTRPGGSKREIEIAIENENENEYKDQDRDHDSPMLGGSPI